MDVALKSIVCLNCGGEVTLSEGGKEATCRYCKRKYKIGSTLKDSALIAFSQATEYWKTFRFTDAKRKFSEVTKENPEFSEAWWGAFVSEYGIEFGYNRFGDKVPTCHRAHPDMVENDPNYIKAVETADEANKEDYVTLGNEIERIRAEIIKRAEDGESYDVFICFKATEINAPGKKTDDYYLGQDIYHELKREGYNVFFSAETLARIGEQEFEPYIFKALSTARVMLVLCSDNEKIESAWVKNEWGRFLDMRGGKGLIPVCGNNGVKYTPYELPEELRRLNAIEYDGKLFEKLKTKIEAYFPERVKARTEAEKKVRDTEYEAKFAKEREELLKKQQAELERFMSRLDTNIDDNSELSDKYTTAKVLMQTAKSVDEYKAVTERFKELGEYKDSENLAKKAENLGLEILYDDANKAMQTAKSVDEYKAVTERFKELGGYKDSEALINKCNEKATELKTQRKKRLRLLAIFGIVVVVAIIAIIIGVNIASLRSRNGIKYTLIDDGESYAVKGLSVFYRGTEDLVIPDTYKGKPVTKIQSHAFEDRDKIKSVKLGNNISMIGNSAFKDCTGLKTINYSGTKGNWNTVYTSPNWDYNTGDYTINYNYIGE